MQDYLDYKAGYTLEKTDSLRPYVHLQDGLRVCNQ